MEQVCDYSICTGCAACGSVCPKKCISFIEGKKGHLYPKIDTSICIDCKKCKRTCPALKPNTGQLPQKAFAAFTRNQDDYLTTTSGGAAQVLSLHILNNGGVVYGCALLPGVIIKHIRIEDKKQLELLKGSKYVQSDLTDVYRTIKLDVDSDRPVLFIGTPCQTAAISALFPNKPNNLLLVDLICHGVPSQSSLRNYLKSHITDLSLIHEIKFRINGKYQIKIFGSPIGSVPTVLYESKPLFDSPYSDRYCSEFFYGFSCRSSCYTCSFAQPQRCSDITIGDFWGLKETGNVLQLPKHKKGISVILPISSKGLETVREIQDKMYIVERPIEEAIKGNKQLQHPTKKTCKIKLYEQLSTYVGDRTAFNIINVEGRIKTLLRPYIVRIKKWFK